MPTWPASLPDCPLAGNYSEQPQSQVLSSEMDAGPTKTRRRFTAGTTALAFDRNMTHAQLATFEEFFDNDIAAGALPFDIAHPRTKQVVSVLIRTNKDSPPYELTPVGSGATHYRISMILEVQP